MINHFYLTLPSDSSAAYYPDNTIARYVTKLPEIIRLDGDYEVALSELVYPHTWYNVDNRDEIYWIGTLEPATGRLTRTYIKSGYYRTGNEFVSSLTEQAARVLVDASAKFTFAEHTGRIRMQLHNSDRNMVLLSYDLLEFLGFRDKFMKAKDVDLVAPAPFDAHRGMNLVYVYCDVAAHVIVGDAKIPLLRVCNVVAANHGSIVRNTYEKPHYVPMGRREFDAIEIGINNELGQPVPFEFGKSIVTLHFRRLR